eukprot:1617543-Lingulodinium_polyedra.AAC.1
MLNATPEKGRARKHGHVPRCAFDLGLSFHDLAFVPGRVALAPLRNLRCRRRGWQVAGFCV